MFPLRLKRTGLYAGSPTDGLGGPNGSEVPGARPFTSGRRTRTVHSLRRKRTANRRSGRGPACRDAVRGERYAFACATRESPRGAPGRTPVRPRGTAWEPSGRRPEDGRPDRPACSAEGEAARILLAEAERADARGRLIDRIDQSGPGEPTARPMNETGRSGVNQVSWPPRTARSRGRGSGRAH